MALAERVEDDRLMAHEQPGQRQVVVCRWASAPLKSEPRGQAEMVSQVLFGEEVALLEEVAAPPSSRERGWLRVRLLADGYEGFAPREAFALPPDGARATHVVKVAQTLLFPQPDIKSAPTQPLYMGARLFATGETVPGKGTSGLFLPLATRGFVFADHVRGLEEASRTDAASHAEQLLGAPYLWGGRTAAGIDCSGLVQVALCMAGHMDVPRDSGPQAASVGKELPLDWLSQPGGLSQPGRLNQPDKLQRGDLVFWKGHVGMLLDSERLLHANAHHMMVAIEPLGEALARIAAAGSKPTALRRP